jgi:hypothetical protein
VTLSDLRKHTRQDFEPKVFFVSQSVGAPLNDSDLGIESFDKAQRDVFFGRTVGRNPLPVAFHQRRKPLEGRQTLPLERVFPMVEEPPCPPFPPVVPQLPERFLEQIGRMEPLVGGQQFAEGLAPVQREVLAPRQQIVALPFDKGPILASQPSVLGASHLIEGLAQMPQHVKLVEENGRPRSMGRILGRGGKRLPHIHDRDLDFVALLRSQPLVKPIQAGFRAIGAAKPNGTPTDQVADHNPVRMPLADRHLVDANDPRCRRARASDLLPHVLLVQGLDRMPVQPKLARDRFDTARATPLPHVEGESLRVEGVVGEERQRFPFHLATGPALEPTDLQLQVHPRVAAGEISNQSPFLIVKDPMGGPTDPAHGFFPRRSSRRMRAWGSPKIPLTREDGRNPGNRYASERVGCFRMGPSCQNLGRLNRA